MATSIEHERTFLVSRLPLDQITSEGVPMVDIYIPADSAHPKLRLRQKGNRFEITKKTPVNGDASQQTEETITLTREEFEALADGQGRIIRKWRFNISDGEHSGELDVFDGQHEGLVLADFEFNDASEATEFVKPGFCAEDVTYEDVIAGGVLSGLGAEALFAQLSERHGYQPVAATEIARLLGTQALHLS